MNYKIIYSCCKSLRICVNADNEITVRCPKGTAENYIVNFVNSKSDWINAVIEKNNVKLKELGCFYEFTHIFLFGKKVKLHLNDGRNFIDGDGVHLTDIKHLKKLYINYYKETLFKRVDEIAAATGLRYSAAAVRDYKSRWGCCDTRGRLTFNYKVFMLPEHLIDYCILHELCHTVHFNHSKNFWKLVAGFMPDYKEARKKLNSYNFVTRLY